MQRGWKLSSRIKTHLHSPELVGKTVINNGLKRGYFTCLHTSPRAVGNLVWSLWGPRQCWPETNRLPDISPVNMQEKHRVAVQGLPPWQDTFKFPNDNGKRNLLKKKKGRLSMSTTNWHLPYTWWAAVYGVVESRTRLKRLNSSSSSYND